MSIQRPLPAAIVDLDRKLSRAVSKGKGVTFSADQLDVLAHVGLLEIVAEAKAEILKEQAKCRLNGSINAASSGSTSFAEPAASRQARITTSGGTTPPSANSGARARARTTFG